MDAISHSIGLPSSRNPRWVGGKIGSASDLIYLAWGMRQYGQFPLHKNQNAGWNYTLILSGSPTFHINEKTVVPKKDDLLLLPKGVTFAVTDEPRARCEILTWIWIAPPSHINDFKSREFLRYPLEEEVRRRIVLLHRDTRNEIRRPDQWTRLALVQIRAALDVALARNRSAGNIDSSLRYKLARDFILQHPEIHNPVAILSDYLQISPSTVKRAFAEAGEGSAMEISHAHRMQTAKRLLRQETHSIKQIAFELGYAYPNDFSRAYTAYFGKNPSSDGCSVHSGG